MRHKIVACLVALALLHICPRLHAAPNQQKQIEELYGRGLTGDRTAVNECIAQLEAILRTAPANQFARVYLGSAYTLRSRDLGIGPAKLEALRHGLALMDEAVAAARDDVHVRLARAQTTAALPGFIGRGRSSREDFALLAETAEKRPDKFSEGDLQIVFLNAGLAAAAGGDRVRALVLWQRAAAHPADPAVAGKVNELLKKNS